MNKTVLAVGVALALSVTSCSMVIRSEIVPSGALRIDSSPSGAGNPPKTAVQIDTHGQVSVDQEPIVVRNPNATIKWQIYQSGYRFDPNRGIEAGSEFSCQMLGHGDQYQCKYARPSEHENRTTKYTVNIVREADNAPLAALDPTIVSRF